ncbi:MAG: Gfo/Idh/MocA family oxidoreductase [Eubacteriales bacterium]|nr:Gfo/Idh/MocA family oxidoreductase [Eubacteriales bacterium]
MSDKVYKVGMIGCGGRGGLHAEAISKMPRFKMVALCDIVPRKAMWMNAKHKFDAAIYEDYHKMLAEQELDLVIIALWTPLHLPVLKEVVNAGVKYIHSEKPVAPTWNEYLEASYIASTHDVHLTYAHQRRYAVGNQLTRKLLKEGVFGKILRMDLYSEPHLLDCGTHTFDQAFSFNEESPVKWVLGNGDVTNPLDYFYVPAESTFEGAFEYENGVKGTIHVGRMPTDGATMRYGVRVVGEKGFIEVLWDGIIVRAVVYDDPSFKVPYPELGVDDDLTVQEIIPNMMEGILASMDSGEPAEIDYRRAIRAGEVIFAFYESMRQHKRIYLPLIGQGDCPIAKMIEEGKEPKIYYGR